MINRQFKHRGYYIDKVKKVDKIDFPFIKYKYTKVQFNGRRNLIMMSKHGLIQVNVPRTVKRDIISLQSQIYFWNRIIIITSIISETI